MSREIQALAVLLLILAVGWLGYGVLFGHDGARLTIATVTGDVQRVDGLGSAAPATAGLALSARDRIVAGPNGSAVLALGPDSRVTINEKSAVQVLSADEKGVRLELEGGKVQATIRPGGGPFGITADGRTVSTEDADFTVARAEDGTVGVVAERGDLSVDGVEGTDRLGAGERLVTTHDGGALVAPADEALLLAVDWPAAERTRQEEIEVRGRTEPGATVRVGREGAWVTVKAQKDGSFVVKTRLTEGTNDVEVRATSVLGTAISATHVVVRDTTAPQVGVEIQY